MELATDMLENYPIFRVWLWEILAVVTAIALVAAIFIHLSFYDGKRSPNWGLSLSLNALLALLSTVFRAMLVVIVSHIISQRNISQ